MSLQWFVAVASLLAAFLAWRKARSTAKRLEQLSQMYWELKYQHGELRGHVQRLTSAEAPGGIAAEPPARPADGFIPLSSLKR
jgi:hypothetical protein